MTQEEKNGLVEELTKVLEEKFGKFQTTAKAQITKGINDAVKGIKLPEVEAKPVEITKDMVMPLVAESLDEMNANQSSTTKVQPLTEEEMQRQFNLIIGARKDMDYIVTLTREYRRDNGPIRNNVKLPGIPVLTERVSLAAGHIEQARCYLGKMLVMFDRETYKDNYKEAKDIEKAKDKHDGAVAEESALDLLTRTKMNSNNTEFVNKLRNYLQHLKNDFTAINDLLSRQENYYGRFTYDMFKMHMSEARLHLGWELNDIRNEFEAIKGE